MNEAELHDNAEMRLAFGEPDTESVEPWEQIEDGRYMPRRVRGSCHGRELG